MEKYEYILKCINDKLKDQEETLKYYREDSHKKDARIRELEAGIKALKNKLYGGTKE